MTDPTGNPHWGSTLEDFLDEEGIREVATTHAVKRVIAWQLAEEMRRKAITKKRLAELMHTSRAQGTASSTPRRATRRSRHSPPRHSGGS